MPIDQWGRPIPDYAYANPYVNNAEYYRNTLLRQKEEAERQLSEFDKRYSPAPIQQEPTNSPATAQQPYNKPAKQQPYIIVSGEKEARNYPIVNKLDDEIGNVHFFVTPDESAIFAKRINPSSFEMEFEIYDRRIKEPAVAVSGVPMAQENEDRERLISIDSRLKKIEEIVDGAVSMFLGGNIPQSSSKANNKPPAKPSKPAEPVLTESGEA